MREIFNDFNRLERRPDGTVRIQLGIEGKSPQVSGLIDGERVRVIYPSELVAEALATHEEQNGFIVWYGEIASMDAIRDIHPETLAEQARPDDSASA